MRTTANVRIVTILDPDDPRALAMSGIAVIPNTFYLCYHVHTHRIGDHIGSTARLNLRKLFKATVSCANAAGLVILMPKGVRECNPLVAIATGLINFHRSIKLDLLLSAKCSFRLDDNAIA